MVRGTTGVAARRFLLLFALVLAGAAAFASGALADSSAPAVTTDHATYLPGDTVAVSGTNWLPNEAVHLHVADAGGHGWSHDVDLSASADGTISDSFALPADFAGDFGLVATGALGETASASFSDAFAATSSPPAIVSDKADYAPGSTVTLTGTAWQPGEAVHLVVNDDDGQTWSYNADVTADQSGDFTHAFQLPD